MSWNCNACTFLNEANETSCSICGTAKPQPTQQSGSSSWVCEMCTYENSESSQKCDVCETPKPVKTPTPSQNISRTPSTRGVTSSGRGGSTLGGSSRGVNTPPQVNRVNTPPQVNKVNTPVSSPQNSPQSMSGMSKNQKKRLKQKLKKEEDDKKKQDEERALREAEERVRLEEEERRRDEEERRNEEDERRRKDEEERMRAEEDKKRREMERVRRTEELKKKREDEQKRIQDNAVRQQQEFENKQRMEREEAERRKQEVLNEKTRKQRELQEMTQNLSRIHQEAQRRIQEDRENFLSRQQIERELKEQQNVHVPPKKIQQPKRAPPPLRIKNDLLQNKNTLIQSPRQINLQSPRNVTPRGNVFLGSPRDLHSPRSVLENAQYGSHPVSVFEPDTSFEQAVLDEYLVRYRIEEDLPPVPFVKGKREGEFILGQRKFVVTEDDSGSLVVRFGGRTSHLVDFIEKQERIEAKKLKALGSAGSLLYLV